MLGGWYFIEHDSSTCHSPGWREETLVVQLLLFRTRVTRLLAAAVDIYIASRAPRLAKPLLWMNAVREWVCILVTVRACTPSVLLYYTTLYERACVTVREQHSPLSISLAATSNVLLCGYRDACRPNANVRSTVGWKLVERSVVVSRVTLQGGNAKEILQSLEAFVSCPRSVLFLHVALYWK